MPFRVPASVHGSKSTTTRITQAHGRQIASDVGQSRSALGLQCVASKRSDPPWYGMISEQGSVSIACAYGLTVHAWKRRVRTRVAGSFEIIKMAPARKLLNRRIKL